VAVCPAKTSTSWPGIRDSGSFAINILASDQRPVCDVLARSGGDKFAALRWRAGETGDTPYSVFVHVTPPDAPASLVAQHDGWPAMGAKPTHTWVRGEIVADVHPLPGLPAGTYVLRIGFYDAGGRLPYYVDAARQDIASEDAAVIRLIIAP